MPQLEQSVLVQAVGGPEQLKLHPIELGQPQPNEVRIRHHAIGVNYIDVYHRTGLYPLPLPFGIGMEGAGVVEAVGAEVAHLQLGDRVAYASAPTGAYCTARLLPAKCVVRLPQAIDFSQGAAVMLKGMTVQYLLRKTLPQGGLLPGDFVLFHAAAGGVGLIACQWAAALGLQLIGTAGGPRKCALALENGAAYMIDYLSEDVVARVRQITQGRGVKVVYDSVGRDMFERSLDCLKPFGLMVSFGNASGPVAPVDLGLLSSKGSLHLTRPTLFAHLATRESTQAMADELFALVLDGRLKLHIERQYALADAASAHRDLEARKTVGSLLLIP